MQNITKRGKKIPKALKRLIPVILLLIAISSVFFIYNYLQIKNSPSLQVWTALEKTMEQKSFHFDCSYSETSFGSSIGYSGEIQFEPENEFLHMLGSWEFFPLDDGSSFIDCAMIMTPDLLCYGEYLNYEPIDLTTTGLEWSRVESFPEATIIFELFSGVSSQDLSWNHLRTDDYCYGLDAKKVPELMKSYLKMCSDDEYLTNTLGCSTEKIGEDTVIAFHPDLKAAVNDFCMAMEPSFSDADSFASFRDDILFSEPVDEYCENVSLTCTIDKNGYLTEVNYKCSEEYGNEITLSALFTEIGGECPDSDSVDWDMLMRNMVIESSN